MNLHGDGLEEHNHNNCISFALEEAQRICDTRGEKFTELRKEVLKIIWKSHRAVKAYAILSQLDPRIASVEPVNVYRALDFLCEQQLIHKIHMVKSYIGCSHPAEHNNCILFYCNSCHEVQELCQQNVRTALQNVCDKYDLNVVEQLCEIVGICRNCDEE